MDLINNNISRDVQEECALWIEWPIVAVGLWYGQAYVMDNEHRCILLMEF